MLSLSVVDCGFDTLSGQTNDYKIGICCFSTKHIALESKNKDWLAWNQDNVLELGNMLTCKHHHYLYQNLTCTLHDMAEKLLT